MTQAKTGDSVSIHYTGKLEDGTVFDSSRDRDPLQFAIGKGEVISGFEAAVVGMAPGDAKTEVIAAENAYGPHREEMVMVVERHQIPEDIPLDIGLQLQLQGPQGQMVPVLVTDVSEADVTLDANHPLAGETLIFDIELVAIQA
ncbi:FKBP-type peptidyl-prolyl cis-trans isomerase [Nodosilinea sp. LEGE 07088]|uniref:FKBP-type peptidyl-prolyl cis-trans isomerase n=1 Tax=Nodosilinea sp. LEGE 07088 TaxID=2777968 RepID=UPI00187EF559|nr:FKBP-type peptidyl-prolyl cis-trans isomerase [Nodosilinea sp. LEGE 07088]MBE9139701.1 FKBP-type peptidyl-prolyl cis-trans isomerase [Nodosilinea sp. LEGE 07088]